MTSGLSLLSFLLYNLRFTAFSRSHTTLFISAAPCFILDELQIACVDLWKSTYSHLMGRYQYHYHLYISKVFLLAMKVFCMNSIHNTYHTQWVLLILCSHIWYTYIWEILSGSNAFLCQWEDEIIKYENVAISQQIFYQQESHRTITMASLSLTIFNLFSLESRLVCY